MLVSVNLIQNGNGSSIYSINCSFNEDLVCAFLTAMESFCGEVFKSTGFKNIDLDNLLIETVQLDGYKLMLTFDKEGENNRDLLFNRIIEICEDEKVIIERAMETAKKIKENTNFSIKMLDAISDFFSDKLGNDTLKEVSKRMGVMIRYKDNMNLHIQLRLLTAKIKVGNVLGEDTSGYETMVKDVSKQMASVIDDAEYYLNKIKNLIYEQYGATGDTNKVDWLELYSYIGNFHKVLESITRSEIAEEYLQMSTQVINGKGDIKLLTEIAEKIMQMENDINMYIKF